MEEKRHSFYQYKKDNITIHYTEKDLDYIDVIIKEFFNAIPKIHDFFEIKELDKPVNINFWNHIENYRKRLNPPTWSCGCATESEDHYYAHMLCYEERLKAEGHQNDKVDRMTLTPVHEYVHNVFNFFRRTNPNCDKNRYALTWLSEGLATNLSGQPYKLRLDCTLEELLENKDISYCNYHTMVNYLLKNKPREYIFSLGLNNQFCLKETPKIYEEAKSWLERLSEIQC